VPLGSAAGRAMMPTMPRIWRGVTGAVALSLFVLIPGRIGAALAQAPVFPAAEWARHTDPTTAGYCQPGLDAATTRARGMATTAAIAVVGGRVLWDYGDQQLISYLASVRKSILAMLFGTYVERGTIKLDKTMKDVNVTDVQGLLPREQQATILNLLAARSGVYHPAANAASAAGGDTVGTPPERGSVAPGSYFLYNNWDFNALGTIFEQETGLGIYEAFERDMAGPMQFQDFRLAEQRKANNPTRSMHPAYHFYLSTRDMARMGYLMLRDGNWAGKQLVPRTWVRRMVTTLTPVGEMHPDEFKAGPFGYGLLWWVWDGAANTGAYRGAYTGIGAVGQFITVLPALDMVVAHKTQPGGASVSREQYLALVDALIAAKCK
jgi:CubicO group peptidase (beta-lactamase class C family)